MPKKKTRGAATKRFKVTAKGRVKRGKAFKSHILNKKTRKTKRNLRKSTLVFKGFEKQIRSMIEA